VTQNLEAYRSYFKGKELAARFDQRGARLAFQHALDVEPRFPLAAAEIAMLGYSYGAGDAGVLREASSLMSQAPAKERTLVECLEAMLSGAPKLAGERARLLHSQFPNDPEVAQVVGLVFYATGDFDAALPAYEHLLRLRPDFHLARIDFNAIMQALGRWREALELARQASQQPGAGPASGVPLANAQMLVGDVEGAVVVLRASGVDDAWVRSLLVPALAATGHSEEALAVVSRGDEHLAHQHRASAFAYGGRFQDGAAELDALGRDSTSDQALFSPVVAGYYATAGAITRARALLSNDFSSWYFFEPVARFEAGDEPGLRRLSLLLGDTTWLGRFTKALAAHRSGDTALALATMRELDRPGGWFVPYYRGRFAAESGQDAEAAEALGRYLGPVFGGADSLLQAWIDARARILLARALHRLGRDNQARETLDQQIRLWRDADPELPLFAEAKALRTRLSDR
jgi:tetratricopeptide (TPR) repeat protein